MMTKIYVCSNYHDNDCGIFETAKDASLHLDSCRRCEIEEMELIDGKFERTEKPSVYYMYCQNCGQRWRSDQRTSVQWEYEDFCDEQCKQETESFYANGNMGIHGKSTKEVIEYYAAKISEQEDPYKGLVSTSSCPPSSMKIFTKQ